MTTHTAQPPPVGGAERVEAVADVGELREQHVERRGQRRDHDQRPGPDAHQPLERGGLLAGRRGDAVAQLAQQRLRSPACGSRPTAPAAGGTGAALASSCGADRAGGRGDAALGARRAPPSETSSSARSIACSPRRRPTRSPNPKSMITGRRRRHEDVRGAERPVRDARRVQRSDLPPDARRGASASIAVGRELVERATVDVLHRERHRAVGQRARAPRAAGTVTSARCAMQQQQRLVLDVLLERQRRPVVVRAAQQQRAVAAVQEVGIAAVACVDLHERAVTVVERRGVELRPPAVGPLERRARRRPARRRASAAATTAGAGGGSARRTRRAPRRRP